MLGIDSNSSKGPPVLGELNYGNGKGGRVNLSMGHFQKQISRGSKEKWAVTTVEVRGTLPGNARERAPTMGREAKVELEGAELPATTGEGAAGEAFVD